MKASSTFRGFVDKPNIKKLENYGQATRFPFLTKKNMNLWAPKG
jgi:hypothetical protein